MRAGLAALAVVAAGGMTPVHAQAPGQACAGLAGAEQVDCLRALLAETQDALRRAEQALGSTPATPAPAPAPQPAPAAPVSAADSLGAEQAARRTGAPAAASSDAQRIPAVIVATQRTHPNRLQMRLENGQVWRQTQSDTQIVDLPENERIAAEIWKSGFGGYRLRLTDMGRILKVERLR